ncbi:MAG: alcohol dehydrogenase catalytic domain-containing protein, partial [Vampirovibrio sp.]|nr:alcohol dehydrogenase catalytic domain-containing protein [Vampirovibrio sp.]
MLAGLLQPDYTLQSSETPYPVLPEGGALIQVTGCGICGSDLDKVVNQKAQPGSVLGHELVGTIQALSETAETSFQVGDRIVSAHHVPCQKCHFCRNGSESMCRAFKTTNVYPGGFSQVVALSGGHMAHTAFKVPEDITDAEASCVEPLGCVLKAIRRGGTFENGTVAVVGLGFIGMMAAQVYQNRGDVVYGVDVDHKRLALTTGNRFANQV